MKRVVIDDRSGVLRIIGATEDHEWPETLNDGFGSVYAPVEVRARYVLYRPPLTPSGKFSQTFHPEQR